MLRGLQAVADTGMRITFGFVRLMLSLAARAERHPAAWDFETDNDNWRFGAARARLPGVKH